MRVVFTAGPRDGQVLDVPTSQAEAGIRGGWMRADVDLPMAAAPALPPELEPTACAPELPPEIASEKKRVRTRG
jgi:hypothetical protein